ncbi:MAG: gliding motility protein GldN [Muribaculaceae bacterium]|nr:gliding motility protein GldN [Muribaculaceae bacterium]
MKSFSQYVTAAAMLLCACLPSAAQTDDNQQGVVRRRDASERSKKDNAASGPVVTDRMQAFYENGDGSITDADRQWMRVIYRQLDLNKDQNAPLYFPDEPIDGQENLFRIIMRLLANNQVAAYEYLDGREVFTDQYKIKVRDMLDRFHILYTDAKGSTERNPRFVIEESDVPANEVLSYYVIERWEYDTRNNRLRPRIEAICPVLHRSGDFGGEAIRYPMFWIKFSDIRPWLAQQEIFTSDDNNLPTSNYDDFFNLTMYDGEIYKTRNLKNKSMIQLYPDDDDRRRAQDSIQASLDNFDKKLWVPSREEVIAAREAREALAAGNAPQESDSTAVAAAPTTVSAKAVRSTKRSTKSSAKSSAKKVKEPKQQKPKAASSATRSVRNRKR